MSGFYRSTRRREKLRVTAPKDIREQKKDREAWLEAKAAELKAAGMVDVRVVGQGSLQAVTYLPPKPPATYKDQLQGICQICARRWAVVGERIAHHGYQRPMEGMQTASCAGARYVPLGHSNARLLEILASLRASIDGTTTQLTQVDVLLELPFRLPDIWKRRPPVIQMVSEANIDDVVALHEREAGRSLLWPWPRGATRARKMEEVRLTHREGLERKLRNLRESLKELEALDVAYRAGKFAGTTEVVKVPL